MASRPGGGKNTRRSEFEALDPAVQLRIKQTLRVAGIWCGGVLVSAFIFILAKPYINKRRLERLKQPGYKPLVVPKDSIPNSERAKFK